MTIDERIQALIAQRKEVQDEVSQLRQALSDAMIVLNKLDGVIEYLKQMQDETNRGSNEAVSS